MADAQKANAADEQPESKSYRVVDMMGDAGFGLVLAWHYLVLFSPVFGDSGRSPEYSLERQLAVYSSMALAFGILYFMQRKARREEKANQEATKTRRRHWMQAGVAGAVGAIASALYAVCVSFSAPDVACLACVAVVGACESVLMARWLHGVSSRRPASFLHAFGVYMVAGGLVAAMACYTLWPAGPAVAAAAPALSAFLFAKTHGCPSEKQANEGGGSAQEKIAFPKSTKQPSPIFKAVRGRAAKPDEAKPDNSPNSLERAQEAVDKVLSQRNRILALSTAVYALTFGLLQGAFAFEGIPLLFANDNLVMFGTVLAGAIICLIPKQANSVIFMDMVHRCSMVIYVAGILVISWMFSGHSLIVIAQIAILAGFNLFDFSVLVYGIQGAQEDEGATGVIDFTRPVVYGGMVAGLLCGLALNLAADAAQWENLLVVLCGLSIIALVATTLMPFYTFDSDNEALVLDSDDLHRCESCSFVALSTIAIMPAAHQPARKTMPANWKSPWQLSCEEIGELYQLSTREKEVFALLAKGRNTEYIQKKLVISTHTAKSHIANIYRKLGVHSSQELLDLVEDVRRSRKKPQE